jgi:hypothetical protein
VGSFGRRGKKRIKEGKSESQRAGGGSETGGDHDENIQQ